MIHFMSGEKYASPARVKPCVSWMGCESELNSPVVGVGLNSGCWQPAAQSRTSSVGVASMKKRIMGEYLGRSEFISVRISFVIILAPRACGQLGDQGAEKADMQ